MGSESEKSENGVCGMEYENDIDIDEINIVKWKKKKKKKNNGKMEWKSGYVCERVDLGIDLFELICCWDLNWVLIWGQLKVWLKVNFF